MSTLLLYLGITPLLVGIFGSGVTVVLINKLASDATGGTVEGYFNSRKEKILTIRVLKELLISVRERLNKIGKKKYSSKLKMDILDIMHNWADEPLGKSVLSKLLKREEYTVKEHAIFLAPLIEYDEYNEWLDKELKILDKNKIRKQIEYNNAHFAAWFAKRMLKVAKKEKRKSLTEN